MTANGHKLLSPALRAAYEARRLQIEQERGGDPYVPIKAVTATLFPADVRDALVTASSVPDPDTRLLAVHQAIERAKRRYPELFRKDPANG